MSDYQFSLIHASFRSMGQAKNVRDTWYARAKFPNLIEHCLAFESTDTQVRTEFGLSDRNEGNSPDGLTKYVTTHPEISPSAVRNWNAAARLSTGNFLLAIADDLVPNQDWDEQLLNIISRDLQARFLWVVTDDRCMSRVTTQRKDILPRHPLMTRKLYESYGYFFDPRYVSVGPDDEWLLQGLNNNLIRDARLVEFHHAIGKLFDSKNSLLCGCYGALLETKRSESQSTIHDKEWKSIAQRNLNNWSATWRALGSLSNSAPISDQILLHSIETTKPNFRALRITLKLFLSTNLNFNHKVLVLRRLLVELFRF